MAKRLQHQHLGLLFLALYLVGCSLNLSPPPPDTHTLAVSYLPGLVKGRKPTFPPARVLVLLPVDKRPSLKIRDSTLPITGDGGEIVGIHGLNSRDGTVSIAPQDAEGRNMVPALGVLRTMDSGMRYPPDIPQAVYTLPGLPEVVQGTIATHFCEAGFYVEAVPFSLSTPLAGEEKPVLSPAEGPVLSPAEGPVLSPAEGPVLSPAEGPVLSPAEGPVLSPAEGPVLSPAEGPVLSPAEGPVLSPAEGPGFMS